MTEQQTQPGTAVATRQDNAVTLGGPVSDLDGLIRLAKTLAMSGLLPDALRGKAPDVMTMILYGQDLGLSPMQSIQGIYVVKGKPQISGQLWIALARRAGHNPFIACKHCPAPPERHTGAGVGGHQYEADHNATRCTFSVVRGDTGARHTETFTIDDARTAKLLSNDNWSKYPKRMLLWRAATDTMRVICPEIALGFYTEGDDLDDGPAVTAEQVTATDDDVAEGEVVDPEETSDEVARLAEQFNFTTAPKSEELPPPPADYECTSCEAVGEHYEDECPKAATPR